MAKVSWQRSRVTSNHNVSLTCFPLCVIDGMDHQCLIRKTYWATAIFNPSHFLFLFKSAKVYQENSHVESHQAAYTSVRKPSNLYCRMVWNLFHRLACFSTTEVTNGQSSPAFHYSGWMCKDGESFYSVSKALNLITGLLKRVGVWLKKKNCCVHFEKTCKLAM